VSQSAFQVDIDGSKTVGHLKAIVKEKSTTFVNIEADLLKLRKVSGIFNFGRTPLLTLLQVSIPTTLALRNEVVKQKFLEVDPLDETEPLSDIFPILKEEPAKRTLHIVIQAPSIGKCSLPFA